MNNKRRAFTLIELLVVIAIALILSVLILTVVMNARKDSRDSIRVAAAEQLALGIRLYKESEGSYPAYPSGVELGVGEAIDAQLLPYIPYLPTDPLGSDAASNEYEYWFYPDFLCNGERHDVIVVKNMELVENGNYDEVCGGTGAQAPSEQGWVKKAYAAPTCTVTPNVVTLDRNGSIIGTLSINWTGYTGQSNVELYGPNGYHSHQWDRTYPAVPLQHPPSGLTAGAYSIAIGNIGCSAALTVNPYVAPDHCPANSPANPQTISGRYNIITQVHAIEGSLMTGSLEALFADTTTATKACTVLGYDEGSVSATGGWSSPYNNTVTQWSGSSWNTLPASGRNTLIDGLVCQCEVPVTQCNDGIDNDNDTLADTADPGCHTGDDISAPYDATITSEINTVDYAQSSYAGYAQSSYYTQATYPWGAGSGAYIVFVN